MEKSIISEAFERHAAVLEQSLATILSDVERGAELLLRVVQNKGRLFLCGNGGSAADSQHFAAEWLCRYKNERRPLPAIALTTDTSALTAIGNDYSFEEIFARQLEALGRKGDILLALTTSGRSRNILRAIEVAKSKELTVIALSGEGGEHLKNRVDLAIIIPSSEIARIQEVHEVIYHAWCEFIDVNL